MPSLVWLGRRWATSSDEFASAGFALAVLHTTAAVVTIVTIATAAANYGPAYRNLSKSLTSKTLSESSSWHSCRTLSPLACQGSTYANSSGAYGCVTTPVGSALLERIREWGQLTDSSTAAVPHTTAAPTAAPVGGNRLDIGFQAIVVNSLAPLISISVLLTLAHLLTSGLFVLLAFASSRGNVIEGSTHHWRKRVPMILTICLAASFVVSAVFAPFFNEAADGQVLEALALDAETAVALEDLSACLMPALPKTTTIDDVIWGSIGPSRHRPAVSDFLLDVAGFSRISATIDRAAGVPATPLHTATVAPTTSATDTPAPGLHGGFGELDDDLLLWRRYLAWTRPNSVDLIATVSSHAAALFAACQLGPVPTSAAGSSSGSDSADAAPYTIDPTLCVLASQLPSCITTLAPCRGFTQVVIQYRNSVEAPTTRLLWLEVGVVIVYAVVFILIPFDQLGRLTADVSAEEYRLHWVSRLYCWFCCFVYRPHCDWTWCHWCWCRCQKRRGSIMKSRRALLWQARRRHHKMLLQDVALSAIALFQNLDLTSMDIIAASVALGMHQRALRLQRQQLLATQHYEWAALTHRSGKGDAPMLVTVNDDGMLATETENNLFISRELQEDAVALAELRKFVPYCHAAYGWTQRVCYMPDGCTIDTATRLRRAASADAERVSVNLSLHRAAAIDFLNFDPGTCNPHALLNEVGAAITAPGITAENKAKWLGPDGPSGILYSNFAGGTLLPAFFVAVDRARGAIVISMRGTDSIQDILTDIVSTSVEVPKEEPEPAAVSPSPLPVSSPTDEAAPGGNYVPSNSRSKQASPVGARAATPLPAGVPQTLTRSRSGTPVITWRDVHGNDDRNASPMPEIYHVHKGMLESAQAVVGVLRDAGVLQEIALHVAAREMPIVVTGHSLGAGVAVVLTYLLRQLTKEQIKPLLGKDSSIFLNTKLADTAMSSVGSSNGNRFHEFPNSTPGHRDYRGGRRGSSATPPPPPAEQQPKYVFRTRVRCVAYAPPGGVYSKALVEATKAYTIAAMVRDDIIPRLSPNNLRRLRRSLVHSLTATSEAKENLVAVCSSATCCRPCGFLCTGCTEAQTEPSKGLLPDRLFVSGEAFDLISRMTKESFDPVSATSVGLHPPARIFLLESASQPRRSTHMFVNEFPASDTRPLRGDAGAAAASAAAEPSTPTTPMAQPATVAVADPGGGAQAWCAWPLHRLAQVWTAAHGEVRRPLRDVVMSATMLSDHMSPGIDGALKVAGLPTVLYLVLAELARNPRLDKTSPPVRVVLAMCELYNRLAYTPVVTVSDTDSLAGGPPRPATAPANGAEMV
jgi:hypothetical protein